MALFQAAVAAAAAAARQSPEQWLAENQAKMPKTAAVVAEAPEDGAPEVPQAEASSGLQEPPPRACEA